MALPASVPGNHATSSASARSASHGTISGRPQNSTTTTGKASARARSSTASANARCSPGSSGNARDAASPLMSAASPRQSTTTSTPLPTRSTAAAMPATSAPAIVNALGMYDVRVRQRCAQAGEHADAALFVACRRPRAAHFSPRVGQRSDHADAAGVFGKRQRVSRILHEHERLRADVARYAPARGDGLGRLRARPAPIRIVEESETFLQPQHAKHGFVDLVHRHEAAFERHGQALAIRARHHVDVDTRLQREHRCLDDVRGHAVLDQLANGVVVADDHAVETELAAQVVAKQRLVRGHRDAGEIGERRHDRRHAGTHGGREGRQMHFAQRALGNVDGRVVAPAGHRPVRAEMLGRRGQRFGGSKIGALEAADFRARDLRGEPRIFARAFHGPAPAQVARDVEHRRERQREAVGRRLASGFARRELPDVRIERRGLRERHGKNRAVTVDHVEPDQERNAQARFLDRNPL